MAGSTAKPLEANLDISPLALRVTIGEQGPPALRAVFEKSGRHVCTY